MDAPKGSTIKKIQNDSTLLDKLMNIIINRGHKDDSIEVNGGKVKIVRIKSVHRNTQDAEQ